MEPVLNELELARTLPQLILKYLRDDEQMCMAAKVCGIGQIRLNINNGVIESIEFSQKARAGKEVA